MSTFLFDEFDTTSAAAWKQKIQVDLKGDDYNDTLLWKTDENIVVKPFYTKEDRKTTTNTSTAFKFNCCQSVFIGDEKIANSIAFNALKKGVNAIEFIAKAPFDYSTLFKNIAPNKIHIYIRFQFLDVDFTSKLFDFLDSETAYFQIDIIGHLAETGNWFNNLKEDHQEFEKIVQHCNYSIGINASLYQNSGATIVQQLAYTLAHANEYLNYFGGNVASKIHINFSVGSNYFFEIAKLRAFRVLWKLLLKEYGAENSNLHIFSQPSLRNKTIYDYNVNILRTTSECMSAILGGSDTVNNVAYDALYHKKNAFGERIARNQLLILQQESYLESANQIADGSYYIESLTSQLAEKALLLFKEIEKSGGFLKQLKQGVIQRKIKENAIKEQEKFNREELVLLGTNKQPNAADTMKNELELYPFLKTKPIKTLIQPIIAKRLAATSEQNRLKNE
ncbi:MAG: methylmalonyl-CoA mutase subunit beta [Polaribacter sp.]|nr:methylmalonyl-CoA mutase subunit beta [Polaribacter sp.]